jgi:hypothetical protein
MSTAFTYFVVPQATQYFTHLHGLYTVLDAVNLDLNHTGALAWARRKYYSRESRKPMVTLERIPQVYKGWL